MPRCRSCRQDAARCCLCSPFPARGRLCSFSGYLSKSYLPCLPPCPPACSYLNDNFLSGALPDTWSSPGAFPELSLLRIDGNALTGMLPPALGSAGQGGSRSSANMPNLVVL